MEVTASFAEVETFKTIIGGARTRIYLRCDATANELLTEVQNSGPLSFDFNEKDTDNETMIECIISTIATDSPTEVVKEGIRPPHGSSKLQKNVWGTSIFFCGAFQGCRREVKESYLGNDRIIYEAICNTYALQCSIDP